MEDKYKALIALVGAGYIVILDVATMCILRIDGTLLTAGVAAIGVIVGGVLGFSIGKSKE